VARDLNRNITIVEIDIAAFQGRSLPVKDFVKTFQFGGNKDLVAGNADIPGATRVDKSGEKNRGHSLADFVNAVLQFMKENNIDKLRITDVNEINSN